jgi:hypothetical protein
VCGTLRSPIYFADVVLADVLTSFAKILADWDALLWCYLLTPLYGPADSLVKCAPSIVGVLFVWCAVPCPAQPP